MRLQRLVLLRRDLIDEGPQDPVELVGRVDLQRVSLASEDDRMARPDGLVGKAVDIIDIHETVVAAQYDRQWNGAVFGQFSLAPWRLRTSASNRYWRASPSVRTTERRQSVSRSISFTDW